jgi:Tat protein translocase TatB subunit
MGGNLFGIGLGELVILAILALVVFGPKRIPGISRNVGQFIREVREVATGFNREVQELAAEVETPQAWLAEKPQTAEPVERAALPSSSTGLAGSEGPPGGEDPPPPATRA